ncbi:PucR family transcriptional regulator ligand-binding domain-containing protein [Embleya sp. NPDC056538]|uniref:helix-turn-helix domain-containing protein n=2 Tax=unclassified Embleya TaxID=2699296 RepID=UPI00367B1998
MDDDGLGGTAVRVEDLLGMPELRLALLAGTGRLGREVRRVSAYDPTAPGRGLAGGELVVAGEVPASPAESAHLVRALATNGAAALVLSPRPPVAEPGPDDVPYPLVEACVRAGLPLFLAPHSIPAVRIAEVVAHRMARECDPTTERSPSRRTRLLTALTDGADTQALLTALATELDARCHVITPAGRLLATATPTSAGTAGRSGSADAGARGTTGSRDVVEPGGAGAAVGVCVAGRSGAVARSKGAAFGAGPPGGRCLDTSGCGEVARVMARGDGGSPTLVGGDTVFAVGRGAGLLGYLVCGGDRRTDEALAHVADLFVLGDARRAERAAVERAHAWELVDLVESDAAPDTIRARLGAAGLPPDAAPIVCSAAGHGADAATARLVVDLIEHALDEEPTARWVVAVGKAEVVVFAAAGTGPGGATRVARALERAAEWWEPLLGAERLAIGIAGTSPTWGTALAEARGARDLAWTRPGRLTVAEGPEIDAYPALLTAVPPPVRAAFAERVLGGLRAYDAEHGTDLIDTLAAFLAANGAWQRCAGTLGVHVSALHQRMGRVRDLTGRDLFSARDRVDLLLALETDPAG